MKTVARNTCEIYLCLQYVKKIVLMNLMSLDITKTVNKKDIAKTDADEGQRNKYCVGGSWFSLVLVYFSNIQQNLLPLEFLKAVTLSKLRCIEMVFFFFLPGLLWE